jgi:branched-chain amino acid transport system ATP-binding protein
MLKLDNIYRSVGNYNILKGISWEFVDWDVIGIVWPNGCWKTSLLNAINWYIKPESWIIQLDWIDITKYSVEKRANLWIWRVFQSFWIFKELTIFENLALAYYNRLSWWEKLLPIRYFPKKFREEIENILEEIELLQRKNELAGNLSWWQMRLLEIARLYLQDTKIYLLDEPTAWVAPKFKGKVINLLNKIIEQNKTVIIVEHDFEFLSQFVDKFLLMDNWRIVLEWDYKVIKNSPITQSIYFWK